MPVGVLGYIGAMKSARPHAAWPVRCAAALRVLWPFGLGLLLTACGGGGSSDTVVPEPVNRAPVAVVSAPPAATVGSAVMLDGSASSDPDGDALLYVWRLDQAPSGSSAVLDNPASARPVFTPDLAGRYGWTLIVSDGRADSTPASTTVVADAAPAPGPLSIVLDQPEPVEGVVVFSLSGPHPGAVSWYLDLSLLGPAQGRPNDSMSWDSGVGPLGTHQIVARLHDEQGGWREIRRNFEVGPAPVRMLSRVFGTSGEIIVEISAASPLGIQQVSATLDGQDLGTLLTPNGCGAQSVGFCGEPNGAGWRYTLAAAAIGPGPHTMLITATDKAGRSATITQAVPVGPVLTVDTLQDGDVVFGALRVSGRVVGAPSSAVDVTVLLDALPILVSRGPVFDASYDLTGVPPNRYRVTVRAVEPGGLVTEMQYRIAIAPSPRWVQPPSLSIYPGQLLAARGTQALVDAGLQQVLLRDLLSGDTTRLETSGPWHPQYGQWTLGAGRVMAVGNAGDCLGSCLYQWDSTGRRSNLTRDNPYAAVNSVATANGSDADPLAQGDQLLFFSRSNIGGSDGRGWQRLVLFDAVGRTYTQIADTSSLGWGTLSADLVVRDGVARVVFGGHAAAPAAARWSLREWRSDAPVARVLAEGDGSIANVRSDGTRVYWLQWPTATQTPGDARLLAMPLAGGSTTTLATAFSASTFAVQEDGSLTWGESLYSSGVVHTLPPAPIANDRTVFAGGLGWIFYVQRSNNTLYAWNAATGQTEPMFDANANKGYVTGDHVVFQYLGAVYRLPLR